MLKRPEHRVLDAWLLVVLCLAACVGGCKKQEVVQGIDNAVHNSPSPKPTTSSTRTPTVRIAPRREPAVDRARTTIDGKLWNLSVLVENDRTPQREVVSAVRSICERDFFVHWNKPLRSVFLRAKKPPNRWSEVKGQLVLIDGMSYATPLAISDATDWGANVSWNDVFERIEVEYERNSQGASTR